MAITRLGSNQNIGASNLNLADTFAFTGAVSGAGGAYEVINSSTSASTSTFEVSGFDNGNKDFLIIARLQPIAGAANNHLMLQLGNDSGYYSLNHSMVQEQYLNGDGTDKNWYNTTGADDGSKLQMTQNVFGSDSDTTPNRTHGSFYIYIPNPYEANYYKVLAGHGHFRHTDSYAMHSQFLGSYNSNTQFKKAKIFLNSGQNLKGTVTLYGSLDS